MQSHGLLEYKERKWKIMFKTIKRIINWCGEFKGKLYIGFLFSFFSGWFAAMLVIVAAYSIMLILASIEPISDSAHVLGVIEDAMNQLDFLKSEEFIDEGGRDVLLSHYGIKFQDISFGYDSRLILNHVNFVIPEKTTTAIIGSSGSGKTTICNLIAKFYDVNSGSIEVGGINVREFTCDSLLSNISMVFQDVYLFHDTIRNNICFGNPNAEEEDMICAAKKSMLP